MEQKTDNNERNNNKNDYEGMDGNIPSEAKAVLDNLLNNNENDINLILENNFKMSLGTEEIDFDKLKQSKKYRLPAVISIIRADYYGKISREGIKKIITDEDKLNMNERTYRNYIKLLEQNHLKAGFVFQKEGWEGIYPNDTPPASICFYYTYDYIQKNGWELDNATEDLKEHVKAWKREKNKRLNNSDIGREKVKRADEIAEWYKELLEDLINFKNSNPSYDDDF